MRIARRWKEDKDRVLLVLIERLYAGSELVITQFQALLKSKGIPSAFQSWV